MYNSDLIPDFLILSTEKLFLIFKPFFVTLKLFYGEKNSILVALEHYRAKPIFIKKKQSLFYRRT